MPSVRWAAAAAGAALAGIVVAGCTAVEQAEHEPYPAVAITDGVDDAAPKTLTLTPDAVRRLELTTVLLEDPTTVPYSAVVYDKKGAPWVYSNTADRTFIRVPVTIERVGDDLNALVSAGPPPGTRVVTRSAIKLYGAETGVGGGH